MSFLGIFFISSAALTFQIGLTRIFSISEWYHFAFMIISLALLGFGASGSFLSLFPSLLKKDAKAQFTLISSLFSITSLLSYIIANKIPFDPFCMGIEPLQIAYLALIYIILSVPFFLAGLLVGLALARFAEKAHIVYSYNLLGSGVGCFLVLSIPILGGAGKIPVLVAYTGLIATFLFATLNGRPQGSPLHKKGNSYTIKLFSVVVFCVTAVLITAIAVLCGSSLEITPSPYKSLSVALRTGKTSVIATRENAISKVDIIRSPVVKYAPGLSYTFDGVLPRQFGITIDGENLTGITIIDSYDELAFTEYLPGAVAYKLHCDLSPPPIPLTPPLNPPLSPFTKGGRGIRAGGIKERGKRVLVIEPHGGLDVLSALYHGAASVTVVESNPLIVDMIKKFCPLVKEPYWNERVQVVRESPRAYVRRGTKKFDIVTVSLNDTFGAVTSGAFSLREEHLYTVEAIKDYLEILSPDGVLLLTRWLQTPPSESIRLGATIVTALEEMGFANPAEQLVFIRGWMTGTFLVKRKCYESFELDAIRKFCKDRKFDVVWLPDIDEKEVNIYNHFPEPYHYRAIRKIIEENGRKKFYKDYEYDIRAIVDSRPFFFHFFKWKQMPSVFANLGRRWLPYGGSGYLVVILLLVIAILASLLLIVAPLISRSSGLSKCSGRACSAEEEQSKLCNYMNSKSWMFFTYFFSLGIGFLFLEISFIHYFILFIGKPTYAFAIVLATILVFSSVGSFLSGRIIPSRLESILLMITVLGLVYGLFLQKFFYCFLGQTSIYRYLLSIVALFPISILMGFPFPAGLKFVNKVDAQLLPWVWGINGCASVIASILAILVSISKGYNACIMIAAFFYFLALITARIMRKSV